MEEGGLAIKQEANLEVRKMSWFRFEIHGEGVTYQAWDQEEDGIGRYEGVRNILKDQQTRMIDATMQPTGDVWTLACNPRKEHAADKSKV